MDSIIDMILDSTDPVHIALHSEREANLAMAQTASQKPQAWAQPSRTIRTRPTWLQRMLRAIFKGN